MIRFTEVYSKAGEGGTPETSKSEYYENGNIPFIKIDDLSNKYITSNKDFITDLGLQKQTILFRKQMNGQIYSQIKKKEYVGKFRK